MGVIALAGALASLPAKAATVTDFVTFSLNAFYSTDGAVASPNATASGSFDITFDPAQFYFVSPISPVITNLSYTVTDPNLSPSPLSFNAINTAIVCCNLTFLYSNQLAGTSLDGNPDITIGINLAGGLAAADIWYSQAGFEHTMTSSGFALVTPVSDAPAATPLPPTWTMMLIGMAGLGFFAYRRQKANLALTAA
jgi:hypothetical protein